MHCWQNFWGSDNTCRPPKSNPKTAAPGAKFVRPGRPSWRDPRQAAAAVSGAAHPPPRPSAAGERARVRRAARPPVRARAVEDVERVRPARARGRELGEELGGEDDDAAADADDDVAPRSRRGARALAVLAVALAAIVVVPVAVLVAVLVAEAAAGAVARAASSHCDATVTPRPAPPSVGSTPAAAADRRVHRPARLQDPAPVAVARRDAAAGRPSTARRTPARRAARASAEPPPAAPAGVPSRRRRRRPTRCRSAHGAAGLEVKVLARRLAGHGSMPHHASPPAL